MHERRIPALLSEHGIACGTSRRGNIYDNAPLESWVPLLKSDHGSWLENHAATKEQLFNNIGVFYSQQRRYSVLRYLCPAEFERAAQAVRSAA